VHRNSFPVRGDFHALIKIGETLLTGQKKFRNSTWNWAIVARGKSELLTSKIRGGSKLMKRGGGKFAHFWKIIFDIGLFGSIGCF